MSEIKDRQENSHYIFLAKNVFWLALGGIGVRVISIITLPIVTFYLNPEAFGIIALFTVEASLLTSLYGLGLNAFAGRMIYKYDRRSPQRCRQYLGVILFYLIVFSLFGLCISLPFLKVLKRLILKDVFFPSPFLLYIPAIYAFFWSIYGFTTNGFANLQQNKKLFICDITETLLIIPIQIIGLVWFGFTWVEVVILQLIAKIIVTLFSLWLIRESLGFSFRKLKIIRYALRYSLPYVPLDFSGWIQQQIDKVFLGRMQAISSVGVYTVGVKVGNAFGYFSRPVARAIKPEISKRLDSRADNVQNDIRDFFNLFFQCSLFLIFAASIFSREIITLLANVKYANAFVVIPFVMFAYMFSELTGIFNLKFVYKNKTIFFPIIMFLGAFFNASLNYFLIPKFNILGAAFATVLANLLILFISYLISQRLHFSRYDLRKNLSVLALIGFFVFLIQNLLHNSIAGALLKFGIIAFYGTILYRYLLRVNRRFGEIRGIIIKKVKTKFT